MATTSITPNGNAYTLANSSSAPCYLELAVQGVVRVVVSSTGVPPAGSGTYHTLKYPGGSFSYGGNQAVYVRTDAAGTDTIKVIVTEVI